MFLQFKGAFLSWASVPISICLFGLIYLGQALAKHYHPIAPGMHLVWVNIALSFLGVVACFVLAIRHSRKFFRDRVLKNAFEIGCVPVFLFLASLLIGAVYRQPEHILVTYMGESFAVPRVYRPSYSSSPPPYESLRVSICPKTDEPYYEGSCNSPWTVELSTLPITKRFDAYYLLDNVGAIYEGDVLMSKGTGAKPHPDGSFYYTQSGSHKRIFTDKAGQIRRFVSCSLGTCRVYSRTSGGNLMFSTSVTDNDATSIWRAEEAKWLAEFESWKCRDTKCRGRLK